MAQTKKTKQGQPKPETAEQRSRRMALAPFLEQKRAVVAKIAVPETNPEYPFWSGGLEKPCRTRRVFGACYTDSERDRKVTGLWRRGASDIEKRTACQAKGFHFVPAYDDSLRPGKMEIEFLSLPQAKALNAQQAAGSARVEPGPNVRLCFQNKQRGRMVPVTTVAEAIKIRDEFKGCLGRGEDAETCAAKAARQGGTQDAALGRVTKSRRKRSR